MVTNKENLFKLGKKITDRIPQQLGIAKITEEDPEYWGMVNVLTDEMVEVALKMKKRVPIPLEFLWMSWPRPPVRTGITCVKCSRRWRWWVL